jgi:hypothetical protein
MPRSALGTIGIIDAIPIALNKKPLLTRTLGLIFPAFFPAISATANILRESGAMDIPVWKELYSSTI